jgi:hypothetical protein
MSAAYRRRIKVMGDLPVWQTILLAAIYLADLVVFVGLCREELRDGGRARSPLPSRRAIEAAR